MADLPSASTGIDTSGPMSVDDDAFVLLHTSGKGVFTPRVWGNVASFIAEHGQGRASSYVDHYIKRTKKRIVSVRLPTVTVGAVQQLNVDGVAGTSAITVAASGDGIHDVFECRLEVIDAGTIGASGIVCRLTLDGGRTWRKLALGVATSYVVALTGMTISFGAGTLIAGDFATWYTTPSAGDTDGVEAAITALKGQSILFRGGLLMHEVIAQDVEDLQGYLVDYNDYGRPMWIMTLARDWYHAAKMRGEPADVDFAATGDTITRGTGSWITDGFKVGMTVTVEGSTSNDGTIGKLTNVTATALTFAAGIVDEANVDGADITITALELEADWMTSITSQFAAKVYADPRVGIAAGYAWTRDPQIKHIYRRPIGWADMLREMQYGPQIMTSKVENGPLLGWSIQDETGNTIEHDDSVNRGLCEAGFVVARSFPTEVVGSVFIALPLLRCDNVDGALSRRPIRSVADIACTVVQRTTTRALGTEFAKNEDGTIEEGFAVDVENKVDTAMKIALMTPPNVMVSTAPQWALDRSTDFNAQGAVALGSFDLNMLGYLEQIQTTGRINASSEA